MATDKSILLCVLKVLEEYSDFDHILTTSEVREKLNSCYGLSPDRRTVYSAVRALQDLGYDVSDYEDNGKGYYLRQRDFEPGEVKLLVDAVNSFDYISVSQTKKLNDKLKKLVSCHDRKSIGLSSVVSADKKTPNPSVILNIEMLDEAIKKREKVSFIYTDYDYDKKLRPRREKPYLVSPFALICDNGKYYLVCITEGHTSPNLYRLDMIQNVKPTGERITITRKEASLDTTKKMVFAYTGKPISITLRCEKPALRYIIEDFGKDCFITPLADGGFEAVVNAAEEGMVFWALQYLQHVEVIYPASLRERIGDAVRKGMKKYE